MNIIHLVWSILNTGLIFYFLIICFRVTGLVKEKLGFVAAIVFTFGILSNLINLNNQSIKKGVLHKFEKWEFSYDDTINQTKRFDVNLEKTLISSYNLTVKCHKNSDIINNKTIEAYTSINGFRSGYNWITKNIVIKKLEMNKLSYDVELCSEWRLFGIKLYSQNKNYIGTIKMN